MHVSIALMMGILFTGADDGLAPLSRRVSPTNIPTPITALADAAPITTWSQTEPVPSTVYYMEGGEHATTGYVGGGSSCATCGLYGCRHGGLDHFRSPGDMPMHIPYIAEPKNYYYFRPYNWFHIAEHQREVMFFNPPGDPRHPYDTRFLNDVYLRLEQKYGNIEILPRGGQPSGASPNDLPPIDGAGLLPLQTYGNRNHGDFDPPIILPASARRIH